MRFVFLSLAPIFLFVAMAPAQEKSPYKALGAPSNPKVAAHWNRYHDYAESAKLLADLAAAHPKFAKLQSVGKTYGNREMWVITITNFEKGPDAERPAFWIDGAIHANEIQATEVALYTAWYLLEMREHNDTVKRLLDERAFYILPMMSPDSRDAHFYEPNTTHSPRSGQRPIDDDKDGLFDEDGPDDLDGDGHITQMRVRDKNGRWKPHPDYPQLLVQAKANEKGEYTLLGSEGIDNDGDGEINEDGDGFYDPNRDWGWNWQPPYVQGGAYRHPFSILENRYVADFITAHPNIGGAQSYHNAGGMILRGPGAKTDAFEASDVRVYDVLGKQAEQMLPGYRYMNTANDLYEVWGGETDWLHQMRGVFAFTNELFTPFNYFRTTGHDGFFGSSETQHLFDKYLLLGEGVASLREVNHPKFGKVEVGGQKKSWTRQPPSFLLEEECHRNMAFTLYHADQMPLVKIQSVEVKPLGGDLVEITAIVENQRLTPTRNAADAKRKITPPDLLTLSGENLKVALGMTAGDSFFRFSQEQKRRPQRLELPPLGSHGLLYARWLVQGPGPYKVELKSVKGGKAEMVTK